LFEKALNCDIDSYWIDWAIEMMEAGFESKHPNILAGMTQPFNQFELHDLTDKVLFELNLDYSNKYATIRNYVFYLIKVSQNYVISLQNFELQHKFS
jgi:hypothetical protein